MREKELLLASVSGRSYEPKPKSELHKDWKSGKLSGDRLVWSDEDQAWKTITDFFSNLKQTASLQLRQLTKGLGVASQQQRQPSNNAKPLTHQSNIRVDYRTKSVKRSTSSNPLFIYLLLFSPILTFLASITYINLVLLPTTTPEANSMAKVTYNLMLDNFVNPTALSITVDGKPSDPHQFAASIHSLALANYERPIIGGAYNRISISKGDTSFMFPGDLWQKIADVDDIKHAKMAIGQTVYYHDGRLVAGTFIGSNYAYASKEAFEIMYSSLFPKKSSK
ncbi:MAG: hypothetical protein AAGA18_00905 [Verrucomicrobiota bacterium]